MMLDIRDHGGIYGGGVPKGQPVSMGKYSLDSVVQPVWTRQTTYNTDHIQAITLNPATNELWCLDARNRKIIVHDVGSATVKRVILLPTYNETTFRATLLAKLLISDTGRVYVHGYYSGFLRTTIVEINPSTGAQLRYIDGTNNSQTGWDSYSEIYNNEIFFMSHTGRFDVTDLNLTSINRTYVYNNSVGNTANKSHIDHVKGLIAYSQTSNKQVPLRRLSDGSVVNTIILTSDSPSCIFTKNYLVIVERLSFLHICDLSGNILQTMRPKRADNNDLIIYPGVCMELKDDVICFHNYTGTQSIAYFDISNRKLISYGDNVGGTSGDAYGNQATTLPAKLSDKHIALPRFKDYGVFEGYQTLNY